MHYAGAPEYERDELLAYMPARSVTRWRTVTKKFLASPAESRATYRALYPRQLALAKLFADAGAPMMDVVVLDANPLDDVKNLHRITAVVRAGQHYSATELAALKARATTNR